MTTLFRVALPFAAAFALVPAVHAHDPGESWTNAVLQPDGLKVEITMAPLCAMLLLDPGGKLPGVTEENFESYHVRLKALASDLYAVTSVRTPLKPRAADVRLTEENDLAFTLVYPRPSVGRLQFHAKFLTKLGEGFGATLYLTDPAGKDLGWDQISAEAPNFEVALTAPPSVTPKKAAP